jgi:dienelactone hydrolase
MKRQRVVRMALCLGIALIFARPVSAQQEFPPPQGKGPVVVVVSGREGTASYTPLARRIASLGYDVILLDSNDMVENGSQTLMEAVQRARSAPHGISGKVGVVGFSRGGGEALLYATRWPDLVSVIVAWYPATSHLPDPASFVTGIKVPVLMFAGEQDTYKNCCLITTARALAAAAKAHGVPLELATYPNTEHGFLKGRNYNASAASDSWQRAAAKLAQYLRH